MSNGRRWPACGSAGGN